MKAVITLCAVVLLSSAVCAQPFNGGLMAGGIVSQVDGDTYQGYHKLGFLGGAYVNYRFSDFIQMQMELEYIQKGSRKNADLEKGDVSSYLLRLHYMEVPLLVQCYLNKRLIGEIGPAADVLLGSYEEKDGLEVPYNTVPLRNVTLSGIAGVSWMVNHHLRINYRFNYSLLSIRQTQPDGYPEGYRKILFETGQYNNMMSLSVCWDFKPVDF
jgi:hypothetical protein